MDKLKLVTEFEDMLNKPELVCKNPYFDGFDRPTFDQLLSYYLKIRFETNEFISVSPVNIRLNFTGKRAVVQIEVFSRELMRPLPQEFWVREDNWTGLLKIGQAVEWRTSLLQLKFQNSLNPKPLTVPCSSAQFFVQEVELHSAEKEARFLATVFGQSAELNLRNILEETVYGKETKDELMELSKVVQGQGDKFREQLQKSYQEKMTKWKEKMEIHGASQFQTKDSFLFLE